MPNSTAIRPSVQRRNGRKSKLGLDPIRKLSIDGITPSPENAQLYRPVSPSDPEVIALAQSVKAHGIQEPLVVTADHWIVSGHRRLAAAKLAGLAAVPCRVLDFCKNDDHDRFMQLLRECNRQRVKSFDEKLREEIVSANPEVAYQSLIDHRETQTCLSLPTIELREPKQRCKITAAKMPFLQTIQKVIEIHRKYLPISDRKIHYSLLNYPTLIHASKPGSTYQNNRKSYQALVELLTRARLEQYIPWEVIHDPTRSMTVWDVYRDVQSYLHAELDGFCKNYWRDLMQSQPNHIEIVGEKNTIAGSIRRVAMKYCIPTMIGRGFSCSVRRHDIAERFHKSGKERLVLLFLSDFDPDGEEIAHSFARLMRDDFGITKLDPIKVGITPSQVKAYNLPCGGKAKKKSTNYDRFVAKYGDNVWELEALDAVAPDLLERLLEEAIDAVIDVEAFNHEIDVEKAEAAKLAGVRKIVLDALRGYEGADA